MGFSSHLGAPLLDGPSGLPQALFSLPATILVAPWLFAPLPLNLSTPCHRPPFSGGSMNVPSHPNMILRMLQGRLKQLSTSSPVLAASFGSYTHRCGRPSCRCHHGGPLHTGQHLTFKEQGKTRS